MRFTIGFVGFLVVLSLTAHGGKVKWGADGKPKIEKSKRPVRGCNKKRLNEVVRGDKNATKCK